MPLLLSLETSGDHCSVALHQGGTLVHALEVQEAQAHASKLALFIQQVLHETKTDMKSLQAIAITSGPGSYTGLRIGTSTAKGLCYALNIPLIAINTLHLLVYQGMKINTANTLLCPMLDARRMEVYSLLADASGNSLQPVKAEVIDDQSYSSLLERQAITFYGSGAAKCKEVIKSVHAVFIDSIHPSARYIGEAAFEKYRQQQFEDLVHFEPFYLKEFEAKKSLKPLF